MYDKDTVSVQTVRIWVMKFKCGDTSVADSSHIWHPVRAVSDCSKHRTYELIQKHWQITQEL